MTCEKPRYRLDASWVPPPPPGSFTLHYLTSCVCQIEFKIVGAADSAVAGSPSRRAETRSARNSLCGRQRHFQLHFRQPCYPLPPEAAPGIRRDGGGGDDSDVGGGGVKGSEDASGDLDALLRAGTCVPDAARGGGLAASPNSTMEPSASLKPGIPDPGTLSPDAECAMSAPPAALPLESMPPRLRPSLTNLPPADIALRWTLPLRAFPGLILAFPFDIALPAPAPAGSLLSSSPSPSLPIPAATLPELPTLPLPPPPPRLRLRNRCRNPGEVSCAGRGYGRSTAG